MTAVKWWSRIVGAFYILQFVTMVFIRAPIRVQGPPGTLALEAAGDPMARFVVDTWVTFGLEVGAIGLVLLLSSRVPEHARALCWAVIAIELSRGIVADVYAITRGTALPVLLTWLVIHSVVIVSGVVSLRVAPREGQRVPAMQ